MAGIQLSGLVSGLDTQSIISQLMAVERQPRTAITNQQSISQKRQSLLQDIATKVTTLKGSVDDLASISTWLNKQSVTSTDDTRLSASYTGGAPPGGYDVSISQLATADRQTYSYTPPGAAGPLEIHNQDGSLRASVQLKAGATIDDAASAINSSSDANVFAVNVNGQLVMAAKTTGASSAFSAVGAGALIQDVAGQDAQFSIGTTSYTRSSNVVTDALPGVTLTLKAKTAAGSPVGLNIGGPAPDADTIVRKVKTFITAYNDVVSTVRGDLSDKVVPNPQSTADVTAGALFGDSGLGDMLSSLRSTVASALPGLTGLSSLADIGISTGAANAGTSLNQDSVDGKLSLDETKLRDALSSNMLGVQKVLGGAGGVTGFAQSFASLLNPYQGVGGILAQRITSTTSDVSRVADQLTEFDARMDAKQDYYQKQFTALETALQQSQSQGSSLASLISSSGG